MENITPPPATATAKFSHETKCCLEFLKNNSEKKRKQQKGIDIKELTDEMRTGEEIEEMTIDREETVTEIRSTTLEKGRDTAINRRWTKKPRNQQGGTPTQPSATQRMTDNRSFLINFVPTVPERWSVSRIGESSLTVAGREDVVITATEGRTPAWNDERSAFRPWIGHQPLLDQYRNWHWPQGSLCRRRCLFFSRRCDLHGRKASQNEGPISSQHPSPRTSAHNWEGAVCCPRRATILMASTFWPPQPQDCLKNVNIGECLWPRSL